MTDAEETADRASGREMRRDFRDRDELVAYLRAAFPAAAERDGRVAEVRGGRRAAEALLAAIRIVDYAPSRNYLSGTVTRLSPFLRYGVLSPVEVRDAALRTVRRRGEATKFVQELAWRDYFRRVYARLGDNIWRDREPSKTGIPADRYALALPADLRTGTTGLPCMDGFVAELRETGYLHNHARMWLAAYVVHWRRVRWQAGASWFLEHLLDGDPASNNLSWQWVASTFAPKPYVFTRENLEQYTEGRFCRGCPHYGRCPFEGSHADLQRRLFRAPPTPRPAPSGRLASGEGHRREEGARW